MVDCSYSGGYLVPFCLVLVHQDRGLIFGLQSVARIDDTFDGT